MKYDRATVAPIEHMIGVSGNLAARNARYKPGLYGMSGVAGKKKVACPSISLRPAHPVVLAGSAPCARYADLRLGSSDPSYVRSGAAKPHEVPSVIFTVASQGKRYFPASMSCI